MLALRSQAAPAHCDELISSGTKGNMKFEGGEMIIEGLDAPPALAQSCSHAEVRMLPYKGQEQ